MMIGFDASSSSFISNDREDTNINNNNNKNNNGNGKSCSDICKDQTGVDSNNNNKRSFNRRTIRKSFKTFFKGTAEEGEFEDNSANVVRYKPKPIDELVKETRFTKKEIQLIYRGFKQECPSGIVNESMFKEIYSQFFPQGDCSNYAHYVFNTIDQHSNGTINFEDFLMGLSILSRGTMEEKLRWIFSLYDINKDGKVSQDELILIVQSMYDLMGKSTNPPILDEVPKAHAELAFKKLNPRNDGEITIEDFLRTCYNDETILNSIAMLETII